VSLLFMSFQSDKFWTYSDLMLTKKETINQVRMEGLSERK
jgi:hypothetical protein